MNRSSQFEHLHDGIAAGTAAVPIGGAAEPAAPGRRLHIERLVINGLSLTPAQGRRLQAAIEHELASLLALPSNLPMEAVSLAALRSASVEFDGADEAALGRRVAQNLMQSLRYGQ